MSLARMAAGLGTSEIAGPLRSIARGFDQLPPPSFQEAIQDIAEKAVIPDLQGVAKSIHDQVEDSKKYGEFRTDALPVDCIAALLMYSAEDTEPPLYKDMNAKCYQRNRTLVKPYAKFLWLFHHALRLLPPHPGRTIYRGVKLNLKESYPEGRKVIWHGPSSCTTNIGVLTCDQFLGTTGTGTIFVIELTQFHAREITRYSLVPAEFEVILPAGSKLEVTSQLPRGELTIITMRELQSEELFMDLQREDVPDDQPLYPSAMPASAWYGLGNEGGGSVGGEQYDKKGCYLKALTIDPLYKYAWNGLGNEGGGSVGGEQYHGKGCYLKALTIDPLYKIAWNGLGHEGGGSVGGEQYDKKGCYLKALTIDPLYKSAWNGLGNEGGGSVGGEQYDKKGCYLKALTIDPLFKEAWNGLGYAGGGSVGGEYYDEEGCRARARLFSP